MKRIVFSMAVLMTASVAYSQNSLIYKAEEQMNDGKLLEAQKTILPALTSGKTKMMAYAYNLAGNIESRLMNPEILKASQKQPCDTTRFISSLDNAVKYFTESYKYDMEPNEKGKVKAEYKENNVKMIRQMMSYYSYAGIFENERKNFKGAYDNFLKHLDFPKNPIFTKHQTDSIYKADAEGYNRIGYFATMLAFQRKDYDAVLKTVDYAIADTTSRQDGYFMKLNSLLAKKDTADWVKVSQKAVEDLSSNVTFCQNLLYYYSSKKLDNEAKTMADEIVQVAPNNKVAWYARGCVYLNQLHKYTESRAAFDKALGIDPNFVDALYNKGVSYVNELISMKDQLCTDPRKPQYKTDLEKARVYYRNAKPLFEKVRNLAPDKKDLWAYNLKNIYANLDDKAGEKSMDDILGTPSTDTKKATPATTVKKTTKKK